MADSSSQFSDNLAQQAASALLSGELVVLPTETLYGVFASATSPVGLAKLRALRTAAGGSADATFTWHAASIESAQIYCQDHEVHEHVAAKLLPGPVRLLIEVSADKFEKQSTAIGLSDLPAHVFDGSIDGDAKTRVVSIRVPSDPMFHEVAARCKVLVGERVGLIGLGDGKSLPADAEAIARKAGVKLVVNTGPTQYGSPSSTVRLTRTGWYKIESTGAWSERTLRAKFETQILFVCTGNTCRSPMAEAIARHYLAKPGATKRPTRVASAGVATSDGMAMTPEAVEALEMSRIDAGRHRSRMLTREMVEDATVIYAMTRSHAHQAISLVPAAKDKIQLLDPSGRDITDPIGGPLATYVQTAEAIAGFIRTRLTADGTLTLPRKKGILEPG